MYSACWPFFFSFFFVGLCVFRKYSNDTMLPLNLHHDLWFTKAMRMRTAKLNYNTYRRGFVVQADKEKGFQEVY